MRSSWLIVTTLGACTLASPTGKDGPSLQTRQTTISSMYCPNTQDSAVRLHSGSSNYSLHVYPDRERYTVVGSNQELGCVGPLGTKHAQCTTCNIPIQELTVSPKARLCAFNFTGQATLQYVSAKDGPLTISPVSQLADVRCGLTQADVIGRRFTNEDSLPLSTKTGQVDLPLIAKDLCHDGFDEDYQVVWLYSSDHKYLMNVYPDNRPRVVDKQKGAIQYGCTPAHDNGAIVFGGHFDCYACDIIIDKVRYNGQKGGSCTLTFDSDREIEVVPASDDSQATVIDRPARLSEIRCSIDVALNPKVTPPRLRSKDTHSFVPEHGGVTRIENHFSALSKTNEDPNCPQSTTWNSFVTIADGNTYLLPVAADGYFYSTGDMYCIRIFDAACVPCNTLGPAITVGTKTQRRPCNWYLDDHRFVKTAYQNAVPYGVSQWTTTPISPQVALAGIECGNGI